MEYTVRRSNKLHIFLLNVVGKDELAQEFTDECKKKCTEASIIVKVVVERLEQGKVTVHELNTLTMHKEKAVKLLPVVSSNLDADSVDKLIDQRNSEVCKFKEYCAAVKLLLQCCDNIAEGTWALGSNYVFVFECFVKL